MLHFMGQFGAFYFTGIVFFGLCDYHLLHIVYNCLASSAGRHHWTSFKMGSWISVTPWPTARGCHCGSLAWLANWRGSSAREPCVRETDKAPVWVYLMGEGARHISCVQNKSHGCWQRVLLFPHSPVPVDSSIHPKHLYWGLNVYQSLWYVRNCNREQSRDTEYSHPMDVRTADSKVWKSWCCGQPGRHRSMSSSLSL